MTEAAKHTYIRTHHISGEVLTFDLDEESTGVLAEAKQASAGRAARTLVKEGPLRLSIMGLAKGAALHEHRAAGPVIIEVRSGLVEISVKGEPSSLSGGDVLVLQEEISHSLVATADTVLLLSVAMSEK